jgi:hypothetical protein
MSQENSKLDMTDPITRYLLSGEGDPAQLAKIDPQARETQDNPSVDRGYSLEAHQAKPTTDAAKAKVLDDIFDLEHEINPVEAARRLDATDSETVAKEAAPTKKTEDSSEPPKRDYSLKAHQAKPVSDPNRDKILDDIFDLEHEINPAEAVRKLSGLDSEKVLATSSEKNRPEVETKDGSDPLLAEIQRRKRMLGGPLFDSQPSVEAFFDKAHHAELDDTSREILRTLEADYPKYQTLLELEQRYEQQQKDVATTRNKITQALAPVLEKLKPSDLTASLPDKLIEGLVSLEMVRELLLHHPTKLELEKFLKKEFGFQDKDKEEKVGTKVDEESENLPEEEVSKTKNYVLRELSRQEGLLDKEEFVDRSESFRRLLGCIQTEKSLKLQTEQAIHADDVDTIMGTLEDLIHHDLLKGEYLTKIIYEYRQEDTKLAISELAKELKVTPESVRAIIGFPTEDKLEVVYKDNAFNKVNKLRQPLSRFDVDANWESALALEKDLHRKKRRKSRLRRFIDSVFKR